MIQRIQTIWLVLAAAAAFLTCKFSFFSGNIFLVNNAKAFQYLTATSNVIILLLTVALAVVALIAVFVFKDRKLQLRLTWVALIISIINIVLYYLQAQKFISTEGSYNITALISLVIPVFLALAASGISSDQKLLKSLDRLR